MVQPQIILASSSQTRKALMDRLGINYICVSPDIDESPRDETHADELAQRLAFTKAQVIAVQTTCNCYWFRSSRMARTHPE